MGKIKPFKKNPKKNRLENSRRLNGDPLETLSTHERVAAFIAMIYDFEAWTEETERLTPQEFFEAEMQPIAEHLAMAWEEWRNGERAVTITDTPV